ncbi:unnamed protein product [Gadus morhua 'NCC']
MCLTITATTKLQQHRANVFSRDELLQHRDRPVACPKGIPRELKLRRRGTRAGAMARRHGRALGGLACPRSQLGPPSESVGPALGVSWARPRSQLGPPSESVGPALGGSWARPRRQLGPPSEAVGPALGGSWARPRRQLGPPSEAVGPALDRRAYMGEISPIAQRGYEGSWLWDHLMRQTLRARGEIENPSPSLCRHRVNPYQRRSPSDDAGATRTSAGAARFSKGAPDMRPCRTI